MPWKSMSIMESRREFIRLAEAGEVSVAELCRRFEISRQTGFDLLRRYREGGDAALADRSRRPHRSPRQSSAEVEAEILALRTAHPRWGGRKLSRRLKDLGMEAIPVASTITEVLRRNGRLDPIEAAKHAPYQRFERKTPNDLWQMDFKGHFATGQGRCHPLTVLDDHSRYSLALEACSSETLSTVQAHVTQLFRRYGLPGAMLADNGSPWGSAGGDHYTSFEVWLMRLGIRLLHGRAYHPQTQGKEERFHRTLNVEVLQGRQFADLTACQAAFNAWRPIYNEQRPHEALGLAVPASRYRPSPFAFPEKLPDPAYDNSDQVRRAGSDGTTNFKGRRIKLSQAFAGLDVAFRPTNDDARWEVFFMRCLIAKIDLNEQTAHITTVRYVSERTSGMSPV